MLQDSGPDSSPDVGTQHLMVAIHAHLHHGLPIHLPLMQGIINHLDGINGQLAAIRNTLLPEELQHCHMMLSGSLGQRSLPHIGLHPVNPSGAGLTTSHLQTVQHRPAEQLALPVTVIHNFNDCRHLVGHHLI